jgi:hypothetical protein
LQNDNPGLSHLVVRSFKMAKSVLERCDLVVGEKEGADYFSAVGSYKAGEGDAEETRYALGAYLSVPAKFKTGDADVDKALLLWCKRMTSADNAGLPAKIKAGDITVDEAAATVLSYNGENFLVRLNETKVREGGAGPVVSTPEKKAIKDLEYVLRAKVANDSLVSAKVPVPMADDPPKTAKGAVNFNAWAKAISEAGHPWYDTLLKQAKAAGSKLD